MTPQQQAAICKAASVFRFQAVYDTELQHEARMELYRVSDSLTKLTSQLAKQQASGDAMRDRLQEQIDNANVAIDLVETIHGQENVKKWIDKQQKLITDWEQSKQG